MTRFSLGIPTAAVLIGLTVSATAQTAAAPQAPLESTAPVQAAPSQTTPVEAAPTPAAPAETAPVDTAPAPVVPPAQTAAPEAATQAPAPQGNVPAATPAQPAAPQSGAIEATSPAAAGDANSAVAPAAVDATESPVAGSVSATTSDAAATGAPSVTVTETPAATLPAAHDMSPMGMYHQADFVVKSVMILLAIASFLSWTVLFYKLVETAVARARARKAARILTRSASLASAVTELKGRNDPAAFMVQAVAEEFRRSDAAIAPAGAEGVKERAASLVQRVEVQASARLRRGMGLLATIGSVAPFVGLFGTVWGIMNSFIGIAETQTTNLAVVAPGIAEALFATAIGLVAAIPAVVIYNHFTRVIQGYKQTLGDAGAATLRLLSRDIDFRHLEG